MIEHAYAIVASPQGSQKRPYSHSIISAVNYCPTWGVIRYGHGKKYPSLARSMALEAGAAMHEVFAAERIHHLIGMGYPDHAKQTAARIFGMERWNECWPIGSNSEYERLCDLGFNILHTGDFYDDPRDRVRTITNMEIGILKYMEHMLSTRKRWNIWIWDKDDPGSFTGVEISFDIELHKDDKAVRYIGTADGLYLHVEKPGIFVGENKYVARLGDNWRITWDLAHQQTGYMIGVDCMLGTEVYACRMLGLKNQQAGGGEDFQDFIPRRRTEDDIKKFINWAHNGAEVYETWHDDWENADRFTHSCNRFFRVCALYTFCTDTPEGRVEQFNDMVQGELSPSEQAVLDSIGVMEHN